MKRILYLYWCFIKQFLKVRLSYRADFIMSNFAYIPMMLTQILIVYFVFTKVHQIKGYGFWEVLAIYGFSSTSLAFALLLTQHFTQISWLVQSGEFDNILIRPIAPFWHFLIRHFNDTWILTMIIRFCILIFALSHLPIDWSIISYLFVFFALFCAILINISLHVIITATTFWIYDSGPIFRLFYLTIYDLSYYPLTIYGKFIENLLTWVIPLAFVSLVPISFFMPEIKMAPHLFLLPVTRCVSVVVA